jgi:hypothetical protein
MGFSWNKSMLSLKTLQRKRKAKRSEAQRWASDRFAVFLKAHQDQ